MAFWKKKWIGGYSKVWGHSTMNKHDTEKKEYDYVEKCKNTE